jgi:REP element-mobilizing transposase RayT
MFNLRAPPDFRGLDPSGRVRIYRRHLPHWRQEGVTYFATFRLADSLPQDKLRELKAIRERWRLQHGDEPTPQEWERLLHVLMVRVEMWLDQGTGSCLLQDSDARHAVAQALHFFDGQRYELGSYVIMPNHVHVLVRPFSDSEYPLEAILYSWKRYTANHLPWASTMTRSFWQDESFDRIVRDEEHLFRCLQYIGSNPLRAGLNTAECTCWTRPDWETLGWKFIDNAQ